MNYSQALNVAQDGFLITRKPWMNRHIFKQVPATIDRSTVPKMQSLPPGAKRFILGTNAVSINYIDQLAEMNVKTDEESGGLVIAIRSYSPSVTDSLASDWIVVSTNHHDQVFEDEKRQKDEDFGRGIDEDNQTDPDGNLDFGGEQGEG